MIDNFKDRKDKWVMRMYIALPIAIAAVNRLAADGYNLRRPVGDILHYIYLNAKLEEKLTKGNKTLSVAFSLAELKHTFKYDNRTMKRILLWLKFEGYIMNIDTYSDNKDEWDNRAEYKKIIPNLVIIDDMITLIKNDITEFQEKINKKIETAKKEDKKTAFEKYAKEAK